MNKKLRRLKLTEIKKRGENGGRCLVVYGSQPNDREEATVLGFAPASHTGGQTRVKVKFEDGQEGAYFIHDVYEVQS